MIIKVFSFSIRETFFKDGDDSNAPITLVTLTALVEKMLNNEVTHRLICVLLLCDVLTNTLGFLHLLTLAANQ